MTQPELRSWFEKNSKQETELWIGYYKNTSKIMGIRWSASVDEAICFGWVDGIRRKVDDNRYKIRFTPRKPASRWSKVNIDKAETLIHRGLMKPEGMAAYHNRDHTNAQQANYSYEGNLIELDSEYEQQLKRNKAAWMYFEKLAPSYKKASIHWVMTAKKKETRQRRLGVLIQSCEKQRRIPLLRSGKHK